MKREKLIGFRGSRTQKEMAEKYGVTQQAWNRWEMGHTAPVLPIMKRLEVDSGIPMEELFFDRFHNNIVLRGKEATA